jgi:hypothetical protein
MPGDSVFRGAVFFGGRVFRRLGFSATGVFGDWGFRRLGFSATGVFGDWGFRRLGTQKPNWLGNGQGR